MPVKTHRTDYEKYIKDLFHFMNENGCKLQPYPKIKLSNQKQKGVFIRTGYYGPNDKSITIFINDRHLKDILRSAAHEAIHHHQNLEGRLVDYKGDTLGQDKKLDELEKEAYEQGNILFRKWTETKTKSEQPSKTFGKHMKKKIKIDENAISKALYSSLNRMLNEESGNGYYSADDQWENEIKAFMDGIRTGRDVIAENDYIAVNVSPKMGWDEERWVVLKAQNPTRLQDDEFYMQHSRQLNKEDLKDIRYFAQVNGCDGILEALHEYLWNCEDEIYEQKSKYAPQVIGKLDENDVKRIMNESVQRVLKEEDDFVPHGYLTTSNWGGKEIQISNDGSSARFRDHYDETPDAPTDWLEIEFDEDGAAYVTLPNGEQERLDQYMRY